MVLLDGRMCSPAIFKRSGDTYVGQGLITYVNPVFLFLFLLFPPSASIVVRKVLFLKVGITIPLVIARCVQCLLYHDPVALLSTLEDGVAFYTARLANICFGGRSL